MRRSEKWQPARFSRNGSYETPYSVTGTVGLAGSEQAPKYICIDRIIGTWKGTELLISNLRTNHISRLICAEKRSSNLRQPYEKGGLEEWALVG